MNQCIVKNTFSPISTTLPNAPTFTHRTTLYISLLSICLLFISLPAADAQSVTGKLRYQEAAIAFEKADYKTVLSKLDEAEALPDTATVHTAYLRVQAQFKILEQAPYSSFTLLESLRQNSGNYLAIYESDPASIDKYEAVYKISEALNSYPKTAEEFAQYKQQQEQSSKALFFNARQLKMNFIDFGFAGLDLYQSNGDVALLYPDLIKGNHKLNYSNNGYDCNAYYYDTAIYVQGRPRRVEFINNKMIQYSVLMFHGSKTELDGKLDEAVNELNTLFGFGGVASTQSSSQTIYIVYKWNMANKTVSLQSVSGRSNNLILYIYDPRFIN